MRRFCQETADVFQGKHLKLVICFGLVCLRRRLTELVREFPAFKFEGGMSLKCAASGHMWPAGLLIGGVQTTSNIVAS